MKYTNANIFYKGSFVRGSFEVTNGRFTAITPYEKSAASNAEAASINNTQAVHGSNSSAIPEIIDLKNKLVIPGLVDIHNHGNSGYDFSTCDFDGLVKIASYLGRNGITSFTPASMTMPYDSLKKSYSNALKLNELQKDHVGSMSRLAGINMEGPYFSYGKRGAQDPQYLKAPDIDEFMDLYDYSGQLIKLVDIAPELPEAMDFIKKASQTCTVSIAHTETDYDTAMKAFDQGACHMTHLFNGMNGINHRNPGPIAAAYDSKQVYAELICDGIHIEAPVIRMAFDLFKNRIVLISDALACCGMADGTYTLGDQTISLKDKKATLPDGTLAGSASNLFDMLKNVVSFGIPMEDAITAATLNPAHQIGMDSEIGSIDVGKKADFLVCSGELNLESVYIDGCILR